MQFTKSLRVDLREVEADLARRCLEELRRVYPEAEAGSPADIALASPGSRWPEGPPVIVVAQELDAFSAIHCIREGADDVVLQEDLHSLPEIVRNVLNKRAEQARRAKAEGRFRELLEAAPDAILEVDKNGRIVMANAAAETMFGCSREELLRLQVEDLMPQEYRGPHESHRNAYRSHPATRPMGSGLDLHAQRRNGTTFPVEISLSPVRSDEGFRVTAVIRDVTERKQADEQIRAIQDRYAAELSSKNQELALRNQQVERANRLKSEFLASMSHELRTPLHTVIGFSELLLEEMEGPVNEKQKRFLGHILQDSRHLLELINDILDISKIEAGRLDLKFEEFSMAAAVEDVLASIRPLAAGKNLAVDNLLSGDVTLRADRLRFKEILYNLLSNAVKFTAEGGRIWIEGHAKDGMASLTVSDTGVGIPREEQEHVFDKFHQVGATTRGVREGTGLGLAITKKLVEMHGGRIGLASEPGQGSSFTFTIPVLEPEPEVESARTRPLVLIAEDDRSAQELLKNYLEPHGYEAVAVSTADEAIEAAIRLQPDAITLDLILPGKSGWHALDALRGDPRTSSIPVIVVSILDEADARKAIGADAYLTKPLGREQFLSALEKYLKPRPRAHRVLIVDDDAESRQLAREVLNAAGYHCLLAGNGFDALRILGQVQVSAIVVDLMMPQMSGFELIFRIRSHPGLKEVPILVLTGKELTGEDLEILRRETHAVFLKARSWKADLIERLHRIETARRVVR